MSDQSAVPSDNDPQAQSSEVPSTPAAPAAAPPTAASATGQPAAGHEPVPPMPPPPAGSSGAWAAAPSGAPGQPYPGQPYADQPYPGQQYGAAPYPGQPYWNPPFPGQKSKIVAGILGILLGSLGIHRFYLGYTGIGIAQIAVTILTCGIGAIWGFIEGILILVGSGITTDADGRPLSDT
jgi:TM2 domain-containing membrane protein YozV